MYEMTFDSIKTKWTIRSQVLTHASGMHAVQRPNGSGTYLKCLSYGLPRYESIEYVERYHQRPNTLKGQSAGTPLKFENYELIGQKIKYQKQQSKWKHYKFIFCYSNPIPI
ncbi:hypothetical protein PV-S19_0207 [Pacmanvirus S19]|nr:hypothetical protein PV-S19_0207 [Pacmanvirus S19]